MRITCEQGMIEKWKRTDYVCMDGILCKGNGEQWILK